MSVELTKGAKKLLRDICKAYSQRSSSGQPRQIAANFADKSKWPTKLSKKWDVDTATPYFKELNHAGMIHLYMRRGFCLEDKAIVYRESRFKRAFQSVLDCRRSIADLLRR